MRTLAEPSRDGMSEEEWRMRIDPAAINGWTDLDTTHSSARVPEEEDRRLLNLFGMLVGQNTASSLIEVDHDGNGRGDRADRDLP